MGDSGGNQPTGFLNHLNPVTHFNGLMNTIGSGLGLGGVADSIGNLAGKLVPEGQGNRADLNGIGIDPADLNAFYGSSYGQRASGANLLDYGGIDFNTGKILSKNGQDITNTVDLFHQWYADKDATLQQYRQYVATEKEIPGRASTLASSGATVNSTILGPTPASVDMSKTILGNALKNKGPT